MTVNEFRRELKALRALIYVPGVPHPYSDPHREKARTAYRSAVNWLANCRDEVGRTCESGATSFNTEHAEKTLSYIRRELEQI